ncbi:MAG: DMP19 family protein [Aureispira sp.]
MYSIKDGNPRKVHFGTTVKKQTLDDWQKQYLEEKIDAQDLFWQYHSLAFEDIKYPPKLPLEQIWKKLTKVQKFTISLGHFIGQVDNGGVWQFFFNKPLYAYTAYEALKEANTWALESKYQKCLEEFGTMIDNQHYKQLVEQMEAVEVTKEERWKGFQSGRTHIPSGNAFEDYFYDPQNKAYFYKQVVKYIHLHISKLFSIEAPIDETAPKPIPRKNAIQHFTQYLTDAYKLTPVEVSIYYTGRVTVENQATQLFLMRYKMPDGWESIGITGYFTHHFAHVSWEEINKMYKKYHKQELVNIYHGWYLVHKALLQDPTIFEVEATKWQQALQQLQQPDDSQVPVNISLVGGLRFEGTQWYFYEGDLYYHSNKTPLPEGYPNAVDMTKVAGESNLLFSVQEADLPNFGGRMARHTPVTSKLRAYDVIGSKYKVLKDNPWGF